MQQTHGPVAARRWTWYDATRTKKFRVDHVILAMKIDVLKLIWFLKILSSFSIRVMKYLDLRVITIQYWIIEFPLWFLLRPEFWSWHLLDIVKFLVKFWIEYEHNDLHFCIYLGPNEFLPVFQMNRMKSCYQLRLEKNGQWQKLIHQNYDGFTKKSWKCQLFN